MLDVVNRLADGFVAMPIIDSFHRGGVFSTLSEGPRNVKDLSASLRANEGHLTVALRVLDRLGWIDTVGECAVKLTAAGDRLARHVLTTWPRCWPACPAGWQPVMPPSRVGCIAAHGAGTGTPWANCSTARC